MMRYERRPSYIDFEAALDFEAAEPPALPARGGALVARGLYGTQVERVRSLFPASQTLFLTSYELASDRMSVLDRIAAFVGIDPFPVMPDIRVRSHAPLTYPSTLTPEIIDRLRPLFRDDLGRFSRLTGIDVSGWLTMR